MVLEINSTFLGKYKILRKLGKGTGGIVYEVEHNNKHFALKIPSKKHFADLENEINMLKMLTKQNINHIPKLFDYSNSYMVLSICKDCATLHRIRKKLSKKEHIHILFKVWAFVCNCIEKQIIPCDLHDENILVANNDHKKIMFIDFGRYKMLRGTTNQRKALIKRQVKQIGRYYLPRSVFNTYIRKKSKDTLNLAEITCAFRNWIFAYGQWIRKK